MKIAIIGAGFGGMAAAFDLRKAGHEVTIFESADFVGGLASGFQGTALGLVGREVLSPLVPDRRSMLGLIRELGWEDKVRFPRPLTVMYHDGKVLSLRLDPEGTSLPGAGVWPRQDQVWLRRTCSCG